MYGIKQETIPKRLQFVKFPKQAQHPDHILYKGFLSLIPNSTLCFNELDYPLEFFLDVDTSSGQITITPKY